MKGDSQVKRLTDRVDDERLVYTVPEAGALLGLNRNASYDAAKCGDIPTVRLGKKRLRVPKAMFHKLLEEKR
jgi:excisionase family DNA binding protein